MSTEHQVGPRIAVLFAGPADDGGFMQAGHAALVRTSRETQARTRVMQRVPPRFELLRDALQLLAEEDHDLVIAHGGQNNEAALEVAARFPEMRFAVTQGQVSADNVVSYDVLQEQSAFLAGILAALTTQTGTVAHLSGIRVRPGLKGRAAYAAGVAYADPTVRFLTCFCGHQDDHAVAEAAAQKLIAAGADRLFTMLNSGRSGAIAACRAAGCAQIGNIDDWTGRDPAVFIGSAIADVGWGVSQAILDVANKTFPVGSIRHIGLEQDAAVRLAVRPDLPVTVRQKLEEAAAAIIAGATAVPVDWSGDEITV